MDSRRLIAAVVGTCALALPANAAAAPTWHGVDAGVPASARLLSVAATRSGSDDVVIAVGRDEATGLAVIHRLAHGAWQQDALPSGVLPAQLTRVVTGGGRAYALGGSRVITLADVNSEGPAAWSAVTTPGTAQLTALALASDGSGGFLGAADGRLYSFTPGGAFTILNETQGQLVPPNGGVTAVAASSAGAGVAAARRQDPNARFFGLTQSGVKPQAAVDAGGGCGSDPLAVAVARTATLAIDTACWWDVANGIWSQRSGGAFALAGVALHDVALAPDASAAAIAGESGGRGTIWRRVTQFDWSAAAGASPAPLRGVAVVAADDMWAVGDGGAVLHLFTDSAPPAEETPGDDRGDDDAPPTGDDSDGSSTGSSQTTSSRGDAPRTPPGLAIVIDDDSGVHRESGPPTRTTSGTTKRPTRGPSRPRRLLRIVRVRAVKSGLRIDFRLAAPAKVTAVAMRGKRAIGRVRTRIYARGSGRIVLRYRGGKPPTTLRIVARRSGKQQAPARPAAIRK